VSLKDTDLITTYCKRLSSNDKTLTTLDLTGQKITDEDALKIFNSLVSNTILIKLVLKQNPITGDKFADDLTKMLKKNQTLESLSFEKCSISRSAIEKILGVITENKGLTELFLGNNEQDSDLDITEPIMDRNFNK